ncbi:RHS repeat-associated core domain-containing protein [Streptomyces sp. NPDC000410]|uniref:RHS repeat-associated core domain-containing protein n=1 Tax=Streptomyces sp. NPDC000410 TaxID=3154254 RepID=UPI0033274132
MGYTIPEGVDTMLDVVGVGWPNVDEDAYRDMADALREFADDADDDAHSAHGHIQRLLSSGQSESLTALDDHWGKVQKKNKDVAKAARTIAGALDRVADLIVARKIMAVGELADLAATVGITLALAPVTAGLSTLLAGAKILATRAAFKQVLKEMADLAVAEIVAILAEPAVAALENIAADLAIQVALNVVGVQDGYDAGQTVQAGKEGLQINSAGGPGGGGPGGGPVIDHDAHGTAGGKLSDVQIAMEGKTAGKIGKAKTAHGRAKGKDSLTAVLDTTLEGVIEKLTKGHKDLSKHTGTDLPKSMKAGSKTHRDTDQDVRDRLNKITKGEKTDAKEGDGRPGSGDGRRRGRDGDRRGQRPDSLREVQNSPREKGISLSKRRCKTDPVDVASGEMVLPQTDLELAAVLPLVLRRTHISGYRYGHCFGPSWASTLDERLEPAGGGAMWAREDGSILFYPNLPRETGEQIWPLEGDRLPLTYVGTSALGAITYAVTDPHTGGLTRRFTGNPYQAGGLYWLCEIEDRNGNALHIGRTTDGLPTTVMHESGYRVLVSSDPDLDRVTALALHTPDGPIRIASFGYDSDANLEAVTNSSDLPLRFTYDQDSRITSWTDRNDSTYQYMYDTAGRVIRTVGPDGFLSSSFDYDTEARITRFTDSTGATAVFHLNELLQVVAETDPLGATVTQSWDRYDRILSSTDAQGRTTTWTWDDHGNLMAVREPDGTVSTAEYDELGMPTVVTGPDGAVWQREYDDAGNNTALIAPDGTTTRYDHDPHGGIVAVTDATGATETFRPDAAGLPMTSTDALGNTYTFTRDAFGRPTSMTDPLGAVTTMEWNVEGQLLRRVEPDGTEQTWAYDGEGNCLTQTDANGGVTRYEYTHFDLLTARTEPGGSRYEFGYDTERRLTEVRNSAGQTWRYEHDRAGRVIRETDFDGRTLAYTHDVAGRLLARTNPLGQTVTHHMDDMGRILAKDVDGTVTSFTYDRAGRLTSARSPHSTLAMEWDPLGRLTAETVDGRTTRFTYDAVGRCTSRVTPSGVRTSEIYDAAGNRTRMDLAGHPLVFTHDGLGQELTRSFGLPERPLTLTTAWDVQGRVSEQSLTAQGRTLRSRAYSYRADHYLQTVTDRVTGRSRRFRLDADGRPLGVDANGWSEKYLYDNEGNQTEANWPDGAPHPESRGPRTYDGTLLRSAGALHYTYDAAGRVIERRKKRLSRKPDIWRYEWDAEDRLVSCTTPDGVLWTYAYDAFARRTAKRRYDADGRIVEETLFSWDGGQLAEQTDSATRTTLTWEYDGYRPLAQAETRGRPGDGDASGDGDDSGDQQDVDARFFAIVTDLIGTPTELVDESGYIAWHSRATQWGTTTWNRDASAYTPLRFPGQYADPETGLHYNHFRHYDPEPGRYLTPDPLGLDPAPNPAGYVGNPATMSDPMGLAPCMQSMEDMAVQINNLKTNPQAREKQTVAIIHAQTPNGPVTFVAGTSKSKLDKAQVLLAKQLGLVPLPNDQYMKVPKGDKGGHAEQNILQFLHRMNEGKKTPTWLPTHGAASNVVCKKFCYPIILGTSGASHGLVHPHTQGTQQKQFYWPARHSVK